MAERACLGVLRDQLDLKRYNIGDIRLTERAYDDFRGMMPRHPMMGVTDRLSCNQCGSTDLREDGTYTAQVLVYPLYQCRRCGGRVKDRRSCGRIGRTMGVR